jgi:hypothetical protein
MATVVPFGTRQATSSAAGPKPDITENGEKDIRKLHLLHFPLDIIFMR